MPYTVEGKNGMLESHRARITEVSLHTADPGSAGDNEVTGNGYARVSVTSADFNAPSGGEMTLANTLDFVGPANGTVTHGGFWDGTTFVSYGAITGDTTFNAEGNFSVLSGTTILDLNAS